MYPVPWHANVKRRRLSRQHCALFLFFHCFYGICNVCWKNKEEKQQQKISTKINIEVHTHSPIRIHTKRIHMESVFRAIFSVSHIIVHPYVRIISRFDIKTLPLTFFCVILLVPIFGYPSLSIAVLVVRK